MSFTFTSTIPASGNNPSNDQPLMLVNNASTASIISVDHVGFNTANGGTHKQVSFSSENTPGAQTDPASVLYTAPGTASSIAAPYYVNQNATFPMLAIKAFGIFNGTSAAITQSFNVNTIVRNSATSYTVTLNANVVTGTGYGVLITSNSSSGSGVNYYTVTSNTTFNIHTNGVLDPTSVTFIVLQI